MAELPQSMKAVQVIEFGKPHELREVPVPMNLRPFELLLKVKVASYCHTDSMVVKGMFKPPLPCTGSHEGAGVVAALGDEASRAGFKKGDRVLGGIIMNRCGHCTDCQGPEGYRHYCDKIDGYVGVTTNGAFADYVVVDARESCIIPDKVTFETAAPLACAGCTIYRAVLQAGLNIGENLGIVGAGGGLGHLGCQFAKALGLVVVGLDAREEGLVLAKQCGADLVVDARQSEEKVVEEVGSVTNGQGVDATICLSDHPDSAGVACAITKKHGTMVQVAQPEIVTIPFRQIVFRDVRIKGSLLCTRQEAQDMLDTVAEHNITVKTNPFYGLEEVFKLLDHVHTGKMSGKGLVIVDKDEQEVVRKRGLPEVFDVGP